MIDMIPNWEEIRKEEEKKEISSKMLRNIQQIGTCGEEDRIYIEQGAYRRIHMEELPEKRVFVFMGHIKREDGKYTTFIEKAIPVHNIEFSQNIPQWNNHAWNEVFQEIRQNVGECIIVGWALDSRGLAPRLTEELEAVHGEQFGGAHQVLLLLDSLEQEECFYGSKSGHLRKKGGFYIYENEKKPKKETEGEVELNLSRELEERFALSGINPEYRKSGETKRVRDLSANETRRRVPEWDVSAGVVSRRDLEWDVPAGEMRQRAAEWDAKEEQDRRPKPRYREIMYDRKMETEKKKSGNFAVAAALLLLIGVVGIGIYQDRVRLSDIEKFISTMSEKLRFEEESPVSQAESETGGSTVSEEEETESSRDETISVEELPGGSLVEGGGNQE